MSLEVIIYTVSCWLVYLFIAVQALYGGYAVYYAYLKKKDERQKYIIVKSMANAFFVLLIYFLSYYIIETSVKAASNEPLLKLWELLHFNMTKGPAAVSAASMMITLLGICLFLNKRKMGG